MKRLARRGLLLPLLIAAAVALHAEEPYVFGKVVRTDRGREVAQSGLKVVLASPRVAGAEAAATYTSPYGTFAIYSLPGPGEYDLRLYLRERLEKSVRVSIPRRGTELNVTLP